MGHLAALGAFRHLLESADTGDGEAFGLLVTFLVALQAVNNLVIDVFVVKIHSPKREGDSAGDSDSDSAGEAS